MRPIFWKFVLFLCVVFGMAGVYELMWLYRPDRFRVQTGVNYLPLDIVRIARDYRAYSGNSKPLPPLFSRTADDDAAGEIEKVYQRFRTTSVLLAEKQSELARKQTEDAAGYKLFESSQFAQYEAFVSSRTERWDRQIKSLEEQMSAILRGQRVDSVDKLPSGQPAEAYGKLMVEAAELAVGRAKANAEAREYGFKHLTDFQREPAQQDYLKKREALDQLRKEVLDIQTSTNGLHGELYDAFVKYRRAAETHLSYADFVYFSVGASTTATFGDISPNSTGIRLLVCLQVVVSIVLSGLTINDIARKRS